MNKKILKICLKKWIPILILILSANAFSQMSAVRLTLDNPVNAEIKGGEKKVYSVELNAGQTARIEAVQDGVDINFSAKDTNGKEFIVSLSPSGLYGDELILVTANTTGEYLVEVSTASPRAKAGKYTIKLTEIRPTVDEDLQINEASKKLLQLAEAAVQLKYNGTIEGLYGAIEKWNEVIAVSKVKKDKVWEGVALVGKGLIYEQLGELQNALEAHLASLKIWRKIGNRQYEGSAINNLGVIYADLGELKESISYYEQAVKLHQKNKDKDSEGIALNNLAYTYMVLGDYERAEELFRKSLIFKETNESIAGKRSVSRTLNNLGRVLIFRNKIEEGLEYLQRSLDLRREIDFRWGIANSLLNIGKAKWKIKNTETFENINEANELSFELGDRRMQAESLYYLAKVEKDRGNLNKAIKNVSKGLEIVEEIRSELVGSDKRYAYFSTVQNYYDLYTDLLVSRYDNTGNKSDLALALEISERSRSRSLIELLNEAKIDFRKGIDKKLLAEKTNLQKELNDKYSSRQRLLSGKSKSEQISKINAELNDLNTQMQNLTLKIRRENPKLADLTEGKTNSAADVQKLLDDETVLIEYKLGEKRSFVWLVTTDSIEIFKLPKRSEIEEKARIFYERTVANKKAERESVADLSMELGEILLGQFDKKIKDKRLAIVAEGILQYIPFSALKDSEQNYLVEESEIVILPSATVLTQLRTNSLDSAQNNKTLAVFADPVFDKKDSRIAKKSANKPDEKSLALKRVLRDFRLGEELPRLLASRQEARNIAGFVAEKDEIVQLGFDANVSNIENANLSDYQIIHFATHGLLNTKQPELSGLVFSLYDENGNLQDGFLNLDDIYNLDLNSDMVVLSACQTALGKDVRGEGLIGISRGFLYAGSKRIVASLWKVDDSATAEFMKLFYRNHLQNKMPASKALQQAKIEMKKIKRYESPYYWSAFTLLGDWK